MRAEFFYIDPAFDAGLSPEARADFIARRAASYGWNVLSEPVSHGLHGSGFLKPWVVYRVDIDRDPEPSAVPDKCGDLIVIDARRAQLFEDVDAADTIYDRLRIIAEYDGRTL